MKRTIFLHSKLVVAVLVFTAMVVTTSWQPNEVDAASCPPMRITYACCGCNVMRSTLELCSFTGGVCDCIVDLISACNIATAGCTGSCAPPPPPPPPVCVPGTILNRGCGAGGCPATHQYVDRCRADGSGWDFQGCQFDGACAPACVISAPTPSTLLSPANNSTSSSNNVTVSWSNGGSWGNGCPTVATNTVYSQENCSGAWRSWGASPNMTNLNWNTQYCWLVNRSNGGTSVNSAIWRFTTPQPPTLANYNFDPNSINRCSGSPYSGRASFGTTNNPITFSIDVTDPRNNFGGGTNLIDSVRIAIVPSASPNLYFYNTDNLLHDPIGRSHAGFRVTNLLSANPQYSSINTAGGAFGAGVSSGNLTNASGIATLVGLNTIQTRVQQISNQTFRVTWTLRFEDTFANNNNIGIYAAVISRAPDGTLVTQNPDPGHVGGNGNLRYARQASWNIDMEPPTLSITNPTIISSNQFSINWQMSDNNSFRDVRSYCYLTEPGALQVTDQTLGQNINIGSLPLDYPSPDQCLVNSPARAGVHTYQINSGTLAGDLAFRLHGQDVACNLSNTQGLLSGPSSWLLTGGSNVSARDGFVNITIPAIPAAILTAISSTLGDDAYLATYVAMAGNASMPTSRQSKYDFYTTNYDNRHLLPPVIEGFGSWYEYVEDLLTTQGLIVNSGLVSLSGNISSGANYSVGPNSTRYFRHNGNLTVQAGTVCDLKVVILVAGNLIIRPDVTRTVDNGCLFVVRGNVTVESGSHKSAGRAMTDPVLYDRLNLMVVTDGTFTTSKDMPVPTQPADGLYIRGAVVAGSVDFGRDLGLSHNGNQPAELMEYDAIYYLTFQNILASKTFALRNQ